MRYLELIRDLFDTYIKWRTAWEPVFAKERDERRKQDEEGPVKDVPFTVVNDEHNERRA